MPAFSIPFFIYLLLGLGSAMYILELALFYLPILVSNKWKQAADDATPISIIISARDEHRNLSAHLDAWLTQKHSCYEVIVVNDCSYDDTQHLLSEYERKYPHFRSIQMHETTLFKGGKKIALTLGIKGAQFERLLFTDADCYPASDRWVAEMNGQFNRSNTAEIVLGIGQYEKRKGVLNYLIRMDTFLIAIHYLNAALLGIPYMAVGRNLAYTKSLFDQTKGFQKHLKVKWGDDDLLINQAANKKNTTLCASPESQTLSIPKTDLSSWIHQKRRHQSTSFNYTFGNKLIITLRPLRIILYYSAIILGWIFGLPFIFLILTWLGLYFLHVAMVIALKSRIGSIEFPILFPWVELGLFGINTLIYLSIWIKKPTNWN